MTHEEIESRIESIEETKTVTMEGVRARYAYVSQRGYYPDEANKANQDAYSVNHNLCEKSNFNSHLFAVYDGHGRDGHKCAQYSRDNVPSLIERYVAQAFRVRQQSKGRRGANSNSSVLSTEEIQRACHNAHVECNRMMHRATDKLNDSLSGTTAISVAFHGPGPRITVSNVGDSRAILGKKVERSKLLRPLPLSCDHTSYRSDERDRVKSCGGRILSLDQIEGLEPVDESKWDSITLGETVDESGDPPRVWSPHGEYPGTAFTRSLGDMIAEELGVFAEPELTSLELKSEDKMIVVASDGVFEFLTNQAVLDICTKFDDPLAACRAVVAESYELWLQYELRTDDITMICIFLDDVEESSNASGPKDRASGMSSNMIAGMRPVRNEMSKEKSRHVVKMKAALPQLPDENEDFDISALLTEKSPDDKARIAEAIRASVIFKDISNQQRELIFSAMEPLSVKRGDWVIRQGEMGDRFYIVDNGKFEVRIVPDGTDPDGSGGKLVHLYVGSRATHAHPSFGELALMYSAPRAASIIAQTDGQLWALHRSVFKKILAQQNIRKDAMKELRKLDVLKSLVSNELVTLVESMEEVNFVDGALIVSEGEVGEAFYLIVKGRCQLRSSTQGAPSVLHVNNYFGKNMLLMKGNYDATIVAIGPTKCLKVTLPVVEMKIGSLLHRRNAA
eukprot:CAMPEP_0194365840 /NCGR_PEP_ID=MMETSP0174-20130528/13828_1 /TAXON_ID=216777 /ORGANISM="Proboscia alata, Strain PI-D3" /LENGTH=678 /DNA_ID=CAMNT_0039140683 /DNA_START=103 /DNA_END=2139 /DNA_ORIENTATION=-